MAPRFLLLADVAEQLNINVRHARALVRSGELPAIQVGGRGQWRVEASEFEAYIQRKYAETRALLEERGTLGRSVEELTAARASDDDED